MKAMEERGNDSPDSTNSEKEYFMRQFIGSSVMVLCLSACGGTSTSNEQTLVGPACQTPTDCPCPADYKPSCEANKCLCLKTETVVIQPEAGPPETGSPDAVSDSVSPDSTTPDTGTPDTGPTPGCKTVADCNCGSGPMGHYTATCMQGMCYCAELNHECYALKRGPFIDEFMRKLVPNLNDWQPPTTPSYSDVPPNDPYYAAIEAAKELGIMDGYMNADGGPVGTFGSDNYLNRAEGTKVVVVGIDGLNGFTLPDMPSYKDVAPDAWFYNYVEAATFLNLTRGYVHKDGTPTGFFGPADVASSCLMDSMMAHAKFPQVSLGITIALDEIGFNDLIAIEGTIYGFSARYRVNGTSASNLLNDLTVVNQPHGEGSAPESTLGIENVYISCAPPSGAGSWIFHSAALVDGSAHFAGLGCYDETGDGLKIELVYDVAHISAVGDLLSGQVFRLVLDDDRLKDSQAAVPLRTVRKTKPSFVNSSLTSVLQNGENALHRFQVSMHTNGPGSLARMVYEISPQDADNGGELRLNHFKYFRGSDLVATDIRDGNGLDLTGETSPGTSEIIVSFISEEVLAAGTTQTFTLKATASGVESNDAIITLLDPADEAMPVVGKTAETTPNTARLVSSFDTMGLFLNQNYFSYSTSPDRNFIWSDNSASGHLYSVGDSTSSHDWTNGYQLGINQLTSVMIKN